MTWSFREMAAAHEALEESFFAHQAAVLDRDYDRALEALIAHRGELMQHMQLEENEFLPIYEREPPPPHGKVEFFVHEHRKLLEFLDEARALLADAARQQDDRTAEAHALLLLLDKETQLKNFSEHHELREERWLFPALDRLATNEERERLKSS